MIDHAQASRGGTGMARRLECPRPPKGRTRDFADDVRCALRRSPDSYVRDQTASYGARTACCRTTETGSAASSDLRFSLVEVCTRRRGRHDRLPQPARHSRDGSDAAAPRRWVPALGAVIGAQDHRRDQPTMCTAIDGHVTASGEPLGAAIRRPRARCHESDDRRGRRRDAHCIADDDGFPIEVAPISSAHNARRSAFVVGAGRRAPWARGIGKRTNAELESSGLDSTCHAPTADRVRGRSRSRSGPRDRLRTHLVTDLLLDAARVDRHGEAMVARLDASVAMAVDTAGRRHRDGHDHRGAVCRASPSFQPPVTAAVLSAISASCGSMTR